MTVEEMDWPPQSPDLNLIIHLWDELERRLSSKPHRPTSVAELSTTLMQEWRSIPAQTYQHLVDSLPNIVATVITAKGGPLPINCGLLCTRNELNQCLDTFVRIVYIHSITKKLTHQEEQHQLQLVG